MRSRRERGFTLMEMLIVLVVIGLIAAVAVPQLMRMLGGAKWKAAKIQLETVGQGVHAFQLDTGATPTDQQGLEALWTAPPGIDTWTGPYVREQTQLIDPWGRKLIYRTTAKGFELQSFGADGKAGGTGDDADLVYAR